MPLYIEKRDIIKKAISESMWIILLNCIVFFIMSLQLSEFMQNWKNERIPPDYLSKDYSSFSIGYRQEKIKDKNLDESMLVEYLTKICDSFMLQKEEEGKYKWIYCSNYNFPLKLLSGRMFEKPDYEQRRNVAVIADKIEHDTFDRENVKWININDMEFEVIGIFKYKENKINANKLAYVNLISDHYFNNGNYIEGDYFLDCTNDRNRVVDDIDNYCSIIRKSSVSERTLYERLILVLQAQRLPVVVTFFLVIVVLLSLICTTSIWVWNKKNEIYVRKICGASRSNIQHFLLKEYMIAVTLGDAAFALFLLLIGIEFIYILLAFVFSGGGGCLFCFLIVAKYNRIRIQELKGI